MLWLSGLVVRGGARGVPLIHDTLHFIMLLQRGHCIVGTWDLIITVGVVLGEVWKEKYLEIILKYEYNFILLVPATLQIMDFRVSLTCNLFSS